MLYLHVFFVLFMLLVVLKHTLVDLLFFISQSITMFFAKTLHSMRSWIEWLKRVDVQRNTYSIVSSCLVGLWLENKHVKKMFKGLFSVMIVLYCLLSSPGVSLSLVLNPLTTATISAFPSLIYLNTFSFGQTPLSKINRRLVVHNYSQ